MILNMEVPMKIDLAKLKRQKATLISMIQEWGHCTNPHQQREAKEAKGLINLIDAIQDHAHEDLGIPDNVVYNFTGE